MSYLGYEPLKLEKFGGLSTLMDPTNLPPYASPDCQDVQFSPGLVATRPGLTPIFAALGGNPTINYLKSYITPTVLLRALVLDSLGNFYKENPFGTLASVAIFEPLSMYANSVSLFGREYLAFSDGKVGASIPRQFDDTNVDRVSQSGPGHYTRTGPSNPKINFPTVNDQTAAYTIAAGTGAVMVAATVIPGGAASESGNTVTIGVALPIGIRSGDPVVIAGVGIAGYNGTFTILSADSTVPNFTYYNPTAGLANSGGGTADFEISQYTTTTNNAFVVGQSVAIAGVGVGGYNGTFEIRRIVSATQFQAVINTTGLANSGNGTASDSGNIVAGIHKVAVAFVTREGYITRPSVPVSWTASGGKRAVVSRIPTGAPFGSSAIVARILIFTAAGGSSFFYSTGSSPIFGSNMVIADNTTTTITIDFSDAILLDGTPVDALFNLIDLGECAGVTQYSSRLFWWGERNKLQNVVNFAFDGGWGNLTQFPLGWDLGAVPATSVSSAGFGGKAVYSGDSALLGGNFNPTSALITQSMYQDYLGNPILQPNVAYSVRVRVAKTSGLLAGTLHINIQSTIGGFTTAGLSLAFNQVTTSYLPYGASILSAQGSIPSDILIQVYVDGTATNAEGFLVDEIEIYPTNQPYNTTLVRASKVEDPESYDGIDGFLDIAPSNGQAVRAGFVIRNNLYFVKERSLYVTQDDGTNEPNQWTIQEVSNKVGTLSVRGVGLGDEWAIIAGLDGVYYFDGGEPQKISQEIQPTWDSINWSLGHLIDVKVDTKRKRVYIAVPLGASATANNKVLTLDYTDGFGDPNPTNTVSIAGLGRKWSPWAIACNSMNLILRSDGTQQLWLGNGTGISSATGKIYQLDTTGTVFSDDGSFVLASDNFNRANANPLGAPWVSLAHTFVAGQIFSNRYIGQNGAQADMLYDGGIVWPNDQFSSATLRALVSGKGFAVLSVREHVGSGIADGDGYALVIDASTTGGAGLPTPCHISKLFGGAETLFPSSTIIPNLGDVFTIQIIGSTITCFQNGIVILTATDSAVPSGKPGIGSDPFNGLAGDIAWDDWNGGGSGTVPINSYWQSGYFQDVGRLVFGPLVANVVGVGACSLILRKGDQGWITNLRSWTLSPLGFKNMERNLNIETERLALRFGTNAIGAHFSLQGAALYAKEATWAVLRGQNA